MKNKVFDIFAEICKVPRPSKHEERISQWLQDFAAQHGIECVADEAMNVIMRVPATQGYEDKEGVILQAHMDMVCEKNGDVEHDFMSYPDIYRRRVAQSARHDPWRGQWYRYIYGAGSYHRPGIKTPGY